MNPKTLLRNQTKSNNQIEQNDEIFDICMHIKCDVESSFGALNMEMEF